MKAESVDLNAAAADFSVFVASFNSVILSTVNADGLPEASYAPCIQQDGCFYVYVSELASHTRNLLDRPQASLLFIEPETEARNLFARKRATLEISARNIERESQQWLVVLSAMETKLGNTVSVIRGLKDFHLLELKPRKATFVTGFGKAFELHGAQLKEISHISRR
ncbi:HugZ family protein [Marinospirillum alkaliphilum]|uniref:Pyridoxamine 5'-phosphate oxidase N-terminal domain-containing protein n=1 Tax=Marinospirillum alkaliphilum DSM 21637 TaxID=1122209 RepID=A0A1K1XFX0_9GAMM|nr:pyridoxamine 5'-phosphate oxidase family protein [Marinospirillum alkaliphilum]SFX48585.1 hypothetical protein SAMN02745752_01818 [Marinospirillum alkaliphilum DSM 21637]